MDCAQPQTRCLAPHQSARPIKRTLRIDTRLHPPSPCSPPRHGLGALTPRLRNKYSLSPPTLKQVWLRETSRVSLSTVVFLLLRGSLSTRYQSTNKLTLPIWFTRSPRPHDSTTPRPVPFAQAHALPFLRQPPTGASYYVLQKRSEVELQGTTRNLAPLHNLSEDVQRHRDSLP